MSSHLSANITCQFLLAITRETIVELYRLDENHSKNIPPVQDIHLGLRTISMLKKSLAISGHYGSTKYKQLLLNPKH